ncbi:hypothetical protein AAMO2058_001129200 [Amorphochlora amoebiformis]
MQPEIKIGRSAAKRVGYPADEIFSGHLPGRCVPLEPDNRQRFTDLSFNVSFQLNNSPVKKLFVSSREGWVFQVNYSTGSLECIFRLHESSINSLMINPGFCVTGSDDKFVRVWPLEFTDFYLQVQFMSSVHSVDVSADGLSVLVGTVDGCLGILDMQSSRYRTILRSHTGKIQSVAMDMENEQFTTVSEDGSIRIWSLKDHLQAYQFDCKIEGKILTTTYVPGSADVIACGFSGGKVRIFNVKNPGQDIEYHQHSKDVIGLQCSPDGRLRACIAYFKEDSDSSVLVGINLKTLQRVSSPTNIGKNL